MVAPSEISFKNTGGQFGWALRHPCSDSPRGLLPHAGVEHPACGHAKRQACAARVRGREVVHIALADLPQSSGWADIAAHLRVNVVVDKGGKCRSFLHGERRPEGVQLALQRVDMGFGKQRA
jgi:hypothetical protein